MWEAKVKEPVGGVMPVWNWAGVMLGLGHAMIAKVMRQAEWMYWHMTEGHG